MSEQLILPSQIPWDNLVGHELEELLYWIFDSLGAKNIVWRVGGIGSGAADSGRDLELDFHIPDPDGTVRKQKWWVEAKGRQDRSIDKSTVERAILNVYAYDQVEVLLLATNSHFTNPTRDWVTAWQKNHRLPKIKLWEREDLERRCSEKPGVVLRLFSHALTPQGVSKSVTERFWEYSYYADVPTLDLLWESRFELDLNNPMCLTALISSELANGNINSHPWPLFTEDETLELSLICSYRNLLYLVNRAHDFGAKEEPLTGCLGYLILCSLDKLGEDRTLEIILSSWNDKGETVPDGFKTELLRPVIRNLFKELLFVCSHDCPRVIIDESFFRDDPKEYWSRLSHDESLTTKDNGVLTIELKDKPCLALFPNDTKKSCPLMHTDAPEKNLRESLLIIEAVIKHCKQSG